MNTIKKSLLVLAGAATLAIAGTASAMVPPYAMCNFKGLSTLTTPDGGTTLTCWLTLTTKVDCSGNIQIVAAGAVPADSGGDPACSALFTGGFPWTGTTPALGTIQTAVTGSVAFQVPPIQIIAAGTVYGVSANSYSSEVCDGSGTTVQVPDSVIVTGSHNFGNAVSGDPSNATFNAADLDNKGCNLVL